MHPDDEVLTASMTAEFADGPTTRILRLPDHGGGWVPLHVTVTRVELEKNTFVGLISLRLPTADELAATGLPTSVDPSSQTPEAKIAKR